MHISELFEIACKTKDPRAAGARGVQLIKEPSAAAIGAGLAIEEPIGRMAVDVGGGTSEVAVICLGGIVVSRSVRVGGYEIDEAIAHYVRSVHELMIGARSAEAIKLAIGSALPLVDEQTFAVPGRHLVTRLPTEVQLRTRGTARSSRTRECAAVSTG